MKEGATLLCAQLYSSKSTSSPSQYSAVGVYLDADQSNSENWLIVTPK